jgi:hypothetical protein
MNEKVYNLWKKSVRTVFFMLVVSGNQNFLMHGVSVRATLLT